MILIKPTMEEIHLAFEGDLKANSSQNVMLYSTKIPVTETTKLSVSHKGGVEQLLG